MKKSLKIVKDAFKREYQNRGSAEYLGVIAATQRSHLYTPNNDNRDIRQEWEHQLRLLSEKYINECQSYEVFLQDIVDLKRHMNDTFADRFINGRQGFDNEFRIAHAQKSLSICLKHLWVRGELGNHCPPVCPIDGIVLKHARCYDSWTKVNSIGDRIIEAGNLQRGYNTHLNIVREAAKREHYSCLAEWELIVWWENKHKVGK